MEILVLVLVGVPVAVYISLATLPSGKAGLIGIAVAFVVAVVAILRLDDAAFLATLAWTVAGAVALAGLVQGLRLALPRDRAPWVYPVMVGVALLGAGGAALRALGV